MQLLFFVKILCAYDFSSFHVCILFLITLKLVSYTGGNWKGQEWLRDGDVPAKHYPPDIDHCAQF